MLPVARDLAALLLLVGRRSAPVCALTPGPALPCPKTFSPPLPEPAVIPWAPVPRPHQEVATTAARRSEPRPWLRAVTWLLDAGLHPKAGPTTGRVAADLARRMDYSAGTVLYDLDGTARRLRISRATVKRHVRVLRELGALAWVRHGSKRNLHLPGRKYAATATIYAATIPLAFDEARGHRLAGTGYDARVIGVTEAGRERAVAAVRERSAKRRPVDNSSQRKPGSGGRAPHSPGRNPMSQKVSVDGWLKDTPRDAGRPKTSPTRNTSSTNGPRRSPRQVARDIQIARHVRPLVGWTQGERLRRLAYALRPLIDQGMHAHDIAAHLHSWMLTWRPARPGAFIIAELRREAERAEVPLLPLPGDLEGQGGAGPGRPGVEWFEAVAELERKTAEPEQARTDTDRARARQYAALDPRRVMDHIEEYGEDDAFDLYGWQLVAQATRLTSSNNMAVNAW